VPGLGIPLFSRGLLSEPQLFRRRDISGTRRKAMRLLQAILKDALDLAQIGDVVRDEPALTYKLLRYLNSPIMEQIEKSIRQRLLRPCRFWLPVRGLAEQ
jgi:c-di-GMP-related signal transduction protein